ncbi:alpha/beta fold hydrolase [Variovorax sp. V213]|uniref:alpha/beta fold hydrolase n=1 Tax=Variovorax sp. V213 TaxID=3065955 RepID=UPI0034E871B3
MAYANSNGRKIYFELCGSGPAVVFLHGAGSNGATWWQQLPSFSKAFTCITIDLRCFGRSVAPLDEFGMDQLTSDVLAVLAPLDIDQFAIVGQSLGGMVGLRLCLEHPQRVWALCACDSTLAVDHPQINRILAERRLTQKAVSIEQRSLGRWFLAHCPEKAVLYAQINHFNPSARDIDENEWGIALATLLAPEKLLRLSELRKVMTNTLVVVGREDPIVPVSVAEEMLDLLPNAEMVIVEDAGHSAYFEKPEEFNTQVLSFLGKHAPLPPT